MSTSQAHWGPESLEGPHPLWDPSCRPSRKVSKKPKDMSTVVWPRRRRRAARGRDTSVGSFVEQNFNLARVPGKLWKGALLLG